MDNNLLSETIQLYNGPFLRGVGNFGLENSSSALSATNILNILLSLVIALVTVIAFLWLMFKLITGALTIMSSGGDKAKLAAARNDITTSILGVVVVVTVIFLINLIGKFFGINILGGTNLIYEIRRIALP